MRVEAAGVQSCLKIHVLERITPGSPGLHQESLMGSGSFVCLFIYLALAEMLLLAACV